jgi:imidazolonepropionase-like amidohydrolase
MRTLLLLAVCGALAILQGQSQAQEPASANREFVVRSVRIFDGTRVIPRGDVWVQGGVIKAVGSHVETPSGVRVIDGRGQTLVPGLIDAHVHTMGEPNFLKSALALGITTEFDMGASPRFADQIEREQGQGRDLDMTDLRSSRFQPTAPDGHGTEYGLQIPTVSSPAEAAAVVEALVAQGADFIGEIVYDDGSEYGLKIPTLSKDNLRAVIDAAHRHGKLAVVHVLSLQGAKDAVTAGADGLVHLFADHAPDDEFIALVAAHRPFVMPTMSVLAAAAGVSRGPALAKDPRFEPFLSGQAIADLNTDTPRHFGDLRNTEQTIRRLRAAGIQILAGTDGHNPGTAHGVSLLDELQLLVQSGMTATEALASATSINASAFRLDDRGQIVPGERADLLLVAGDPTTNIADINNITAVWKFGVQDDREAYRETLDTEKATERLHRQGPAPAGSESGLVSDFEDGATPAFGFGWSLSTGRILGGACPRGQIAVVDGGSNGSHGSLQITGDITPGVFGWAGAMFFPGPAPMVPVNLSGKRAITFWTRGDGRTYQVMLLAKSKGSMPLSRSFTAGADWAKVTMPLSDFRTDASDLQALMFAEVAIPGHFTFQIDDVRLER